MVKWDIRLSLARVKEKEDRKDKDERLAYYCHEQEEEKWKLTEAIVNTGCETTIVGEL